MMRPFAVRVVVLPLALGLAACSTVGPAAARGQIQPQAPLATETEIVGAGPEKREPTPIGRLPKEPRPLTIEQLDGVDRGRAVAALATVQNRVYECMPDQSGALHVRIIKRGDRTHITIQPGTSLDPRQQRCVLETLSTLNFDDEWNRSSPSDRPAGFSTLLRIDF